MEKNPLSIAQVMVITNIEVCISAFSDNPEYYFKKIMDLIDTHQITEHKEIMNYLYGLFLQKGSPSHIKEFQRKYNIQPE